jgi:hypothetical protein
LEPWRLGKPRLGGSEAGRGRPWHRCKRRVRGRTNEVPILEPAWGHERHLGDDCACQRRENRAVLDSTVPLHERPKRIGPTGRRPTFQIAACNNGRIPRPRDLICAKFLPKMGNPVRRQTPRRGECHGGHNNTKVTVEQFVDEPSHRNLAGPNLAIAERSNTMSDITNEQAEDEILASEISDESLEGAAAAGHSGAYTMGFCTGLAACPA